MKKIGQSMAAVMATMRSAVGMNAQPQANPALPVGGFKGKAKYQFINTLKRISPKKLYASAKLRKIKSGNAVSPYRSGRGAIGARERAVGKHWRVA